MPFKNKEAKKEYQRKLMAQRRAQAKGLTNQQPIENVRPIEFQKDVRPSPGATHQKLDPPSVRPEPIVLDPAKLSQNVRPLIKKLDPPSVRPLEVELINGKCQGYGVNPQTKEYYCNSCEYHQYRNKTKPWLKVIAEWEQEDSKPQPTITSNLWTDYYTCNKPKCQTCINQGIKDDEYKFCSLTKKPTPIYNEWGTKIIHTFNDIYACNVYHWTIYQGDSNKIKDPPQEKKPIANAKINNLETFNQIRTSSLP